MRSYFREQSRGNWFTDSGKPDTEQLSLGCLQRIADATEVMSKNYADLIRQRDWYERQMKRERELREQRDRTIAALRGVITRLKRKAVEM